MTEDQMLQAEQAKKTESVTFNHNQSEQKNANQIKIKIRI